MTKIVAQHILKCITWALFSNTMTLTLTLTLKRVYFNNNEDCKLRKKYFFKVHTI